MQLDGGHVLFTGDLDLMRLRRLGTFKEIVMIQPLEESREAFSPGVIKPRPLVELAQDAVGITRQCR